MKKLMLVALALIVSMGVWAGGKKEASTETMADEKIKLSMNAYVDLTDPVTQGNWEKLLAAFQESHPDIELEIEYGFDEAYHNKLQAMAVAKQLPDLLFLWPGKRTGMVTGAGLIKDISDRVKPYASEFSPMAVAPQGPNGEIYELPEQVTATHVMYANEKLMKDLGLTYPKTLAELVKQGETIRAAGLIPIGMANKGGWQMQSCLLSALVERTGGSAWLDKAIKGQASFEDAEFVNALKVIDTLSKENLLSPGINQSEYGAGLTSFVNEQAVYYIDGGWRVNNLVGELTAEQKEYVTLNVFPEVPGTKGTKASTAAVAGTGYGMNANLTGAKADAAWEWIWFYSGPEGSKIRQADGALPAYNLPMPSDVDPLIKKLSEFVGSTPAGHVIDAVLDGEGMGVLHPGIQEMILGNKTAADVAADYEAWVAANDSGRK